MSQISVWRFETFYDFSPAVPAIRRDPVGAVVLTASNATIEFIKEAFSDGFVDRSITGRKRSRIQGTRLSGTLSFNKIIGISSGVQNATNFKTRVLMKQDIGLDRVLQAAETDTGETGVTSFVMSEKGLGTLSSISNFYTGMKLNILTGTPQIRRVTAYNGATRTFTVDSAVTFTSGTDVDIIVPAGIPAGFYFNNQDNTTNEISCVLAGVSSMGVNVESQIFTQPFTVDIESRDLIEDIPTSWMSF